MASIFKRSKRRKNEPYWIQYTDHLGKRKTAKGFTDKGLTEQLAGKLETEARLRSSGLIDGEQERYALERQAPIADHLNKFEETLKDHTGKHVKLTMGRIRRIVAGCNFATLSDITPEAVQSFLRSMRKTENMGIGHRTYNHYVQTINSFCKWCVATDRLLSSPLKGLERLNPETDVRHPRRALTPDEISRLVEAARNSGERVQNLHPELRARAYTFAYFTGLRKQEIASLTPASFHLDDDPPTVTVAAACSKHRRKDVLPLHPELVSMLRVWLTGLKPTEHLFPLLGEKSLSEAIRSDLERAGIPYRTAEGFADFHAAGRHTYITQLLRSGASLPEAKELARHSDVKMTMRYTHIGIEDQAKAVGNLPFPKAAPKAEEAAKPSNDAALHMRCISGGSDRHPVTSNGNRASAKRCHNPCSGKGFDSNCRQSSSAGTAGRAGGTPALLNTGGKHTLADLLKSFSCGDVAKRQ